MFGRMVEGITSIPALSNPVQRKHARILQTLMGLQVLLYLLFCALSMPAILLSDPLGYISLIFWVTPCVLIGIAFWILHRGHFQTATLLTTLTSSLTTTLYMALIGFPPSAWVSIFSSALPIMVAGIIGNRFVSLFTSSFWIIALGVVGYLYRDVPTAISYASLKTDSWVVQIAFFAIVLIIFVLCLREFAHAYEENTHLLIERQHELEKIQSQQEILINERTVELQHTLQDVEKQRQTLSTTLAELQQSQMLVAQLRSPLITVLPYVILVPLVGILDAPRAQTLIESLLLKLEQDRARLVIIDLTGVELIDTAATEAVVRLRAIAQLLGAQLWLVGVRPEIAQTIVSLGTELAQVPSYPDLWSAVARVLQGFEYHDGKQQALAMPSTDIGKL